MSNYKRIHWFGVTFTGVRMIVGAFTVLYVLGKGFSLSDIILVKGWQIAFLIIIDLPVAKYADQGHQKLVVGMGIAFAAAWLVTTTVSDSFIYLIIAESFNAISLALFNGAFTALLVNVGNKEGVKTKNILSQFASHQYLAMVIGIAVGFLVAEDTTDPLIWWLAGTLAGLISLLFLTLVSSEQGRSPKHNEIRSMKKDLKLILFYAKTNAVPIILSAIVYHYLVQFWQASLSENLNSASFVSAIFVGCLLAQSAAGSLSSKLTKYREPIVNLSIGCAILISLWGMFILDRMTIVIFPIILAFFWIRLLSIAQGIWLQEKIPSDLRASASALLGTISRIIVVILSAPIAAVVTNVNIGIIYTGLGFALLLGLILNLFIPKMLIFLTNKNA